MTIPKIKSDYALLDVKVGRSRLARHFDSRPVWGECPQDLRVPVTITGYIDCVFGGDDGVSQDFGVVVTSVKTKQPRKRT